MPKERSPHWLLFSGSSHPSLAQEVAHSLGVSLGQCRLGFFPDGETSVEILENVRGRDTFVLQTIGRDPNNYLIELLVMIDALKRASASSIVAIIPYFGYSRQDRKDRARVPITAKLVANLLVEAGATRVVVMDLHANQVQGFFDIPVDHLHAAVPLLKGIHGLDSTKTVVVAPDIGSVKLAKAYAAALQCDFGIVDKVRTSAENVEADTLVGNVRGKDVLLADDMCSTGGTMVSAAKACREKGASRVLAVVTHGIFAGEAIQEIEASPIEALWVSNTLPKTALWKNSTKLVQISVARQFAQAIHCVNSHESISSLNQIDCCDFKPRMAGE